MVDANPTRGPIYIDVYEVQSDNIALLENTSTQGQPNAHDYQSTVGSLLYVVRYTGSDIAFAVRKATRRTNKLQLHDWKLVKHIKRNACNKARYEARCRNEREIISC